MRAWGRRSSRQNIARFRAAALGSQAVVLRVPSLWPVDVAVDKKYRRLVDKGGNLLNENSSFESRLGATLFS